jgi:hypothetical protein
MVDATIQVTGVDAPVWAEDLRRELTAGQTAGDHVGSVEVERSAELVMAVIGLAFSGVSTAKTIWDWWQASKKTKGGGEQVTVRIVFGDGEQVDLSSVDEGQLQVIVERRAGQAG